MDALVCTAAGLSSRMGAFKPLLPLGGTSVIRTLLARYRSCGVEQVVLVTGRNADELEEHVKDLGVTCCRNERFAETDMFTSVKIGLRAALELYGPGTGGPAPAGDGSILVTPADIPLVAPGTIRAVLACGADACAPEVGTATGHPLCLSWHAAKQVLACGGEGGLRGALDALGLRIRPVPVEDPGALLDADTPADYECLLRLYQKQQARS